MCKILILFDSDTQKNEHLAIVSETVLSKLNTDVRVRRVAPIGTDNRKTEEHYISNVTIVNREDLIWADGYIFSFPIHTGTISASMKYFFDNYHEAALSGIFLNKPATAMSVGKISHAGAETGVQQLYSMLMQWGALIVSTSILFSKLMHDNGNPYGLSFILDEKNNFESNSKLEEILTAHFKRFIDITAKFNKKIDTEINSPYTIVDSLS